MNTTTVSCHIDAPRPAVYRALLDARAVERWKVPDGMTCRVHEFEPREGGSIRISLTYDSPDEKGKTTRHTDTYRGRFARLVPNEEMVEIDEFESDDPALQGEMIVTIILSDEDGGTRVVAVHKGLPDVIPPEQNELGWRMSFEKLKVLLEDGDRF